MFQGMRYVCAVYREGSFSRAAKSLYISQPSLSAAVKKVEEKVGFPIFDRSVNPIRLTEPGREYIRSAEMILDIQTGFEKYLDDMRQLRSGSLAVGGTSLFTSVLLPGVLSAFSARYPHIQVHLLEGSTAELEAQLFSGRLDLVLDNGAMEEELYGRAFFCQEHLLLTVPRGFAANRQAAVYALTAAEVRRGRHLQEETPCVPLELFREEPFLLLKAGNDTRQRADGFFRRSGFAPHIRLELDQQTTAYNLACYGMGATFIGDLLIRHAPDQQSVVYYRLGREQASRAIHFYYKRGRYLSRAVREFLRCSADLAREAAGE